MKRTISDWLTQAHSAKNEVDAKRALHEAMSQAVSCFDWRFLLRGSAEIKFTTPDYLTEIATRTLEAGIQAPEVWAFRDVATLRATRLNDSLGARKALEVGIRSFKKKSARGYEWALLAQGYSETLNDKVGAQQCLEEGLAAARAHCNVDDLCSVACVWSELLEHKKATELVAEAETMAINDPRAPWGVANAWRRLGDQDAARRVLNTALAKATTCEAVLHVVKARASHNQLDEARLALARANDFATTAQEWFDIAETAFKTKLGEIPMRHALKHVETFVDDEHWQYQVSSAYRQWLNDEEAVARLGPSGLRPEALRTPVRIFEGWEASASHLFDWLRVHITPEILTSIARADCGMDADEHFAALRDICTTGVVPRTLRWVPGEAVALTRWSTGETVNHLERAFCCVLLCLSSSEDELVNTGPILVESCLALGNEAHTFAIEFFVWWYETDGITGNPEIDTIEDSVDAVALMLLIVLQAAMNPDDSRLPQLVDILLKHPDCPPSTLAEWLANSLRAEIWVDLIERILVPVQADYPHITTLLHLLGRI